MNDGILGRVRRPLPGSAQSMAARRGPPHPGRHRHLFSRHHSGGSVPRSAEERSRSKQSASVLKSRVSYRSAPIGLALFDTKDFRYLRLNDRQAEFFGLTPEQIVGRTLTEMAPIEGLGELFEQVAAGEPVINYPFGGGTGHAPGRAPLLDGELFSCFCRRWNGAGDHCGVARNHPAKKD